MTSLTMGGRIHEGQCILGCNQGCAFGSVKFEKTEWRYRVSRLLDKPGVEERGRG